MLTTSLLLASHLASLGQVKSACTAHYVTMGFVRARSEKAIYYRVLGNYRDRAKRQMVADQQILFKAY